MAELSKEKRGMHLDTLQHRVPDPEVRHSARVAVDAHIDTVEADRDRLREENERLRGESRPSVKVEWRDAPNASIGVVGGHEVLHVGIADGGWCAMLHGRYIKNIEGKIARQADADEAKRAAEQALQNWLSESIGERECVYLELKLAGTERVLYRVGCTPGLSVGTQPWAFCPFCGYRIRGMGE